MPCIFCRQKYVVVLVDRWSRPKTTPGIRQMNRFNHVTASFVDRIQVAVEPPCKHVVATGDRNRSSQSAWDIARPLDMTIVV